MPINVIWTPIDTAVAYVLYKRIGNSPIDLDNDLFQLLPAEEPLSFADTAYNRETLQETGYTYGITALGPGGESDLSNVQFIQFNFDETLFVETWDIGLPPFTESTEFTEMWEFAFGLSPNQLYLEEWDVTISGPGTLSYDEDWEPKEFSNPGALEYDEDWENKEFTNPGSFEWQEDWELPSVIFTPSFVEPWDFPASPIFTLDFDEDWES